MLQNKLPENFPLKKVNLLEGGHSDIILSVSISPNCKLIGSGSNDSNIKIWDIASQRCTTTLFNHNYAVNQVIFTHSSDSIISCSDDTTIRIWNISTKKCAYIFTDHQHEVYCIALSHNGKIIGSGSSNGVIKLFNLNSKQCELSIDAHSYYIITITFSIDDQLLYSGSADDTIKIWRINSRECLSTLDNFGNSIISIGFSQDNTKFLTAGGNDYEFKLWDINSGQKIATFEGHSDWIHSFSFTPDSNNIITGSKDCTIRIQGIDSKECLKGHESTVFSIAVSVDGKKIASGDGVNIIKVWDMETLKEEKQLIQDICRGAENSVYLASDNKRIITHCDNGSCKIWDLKIAKLINEINFGSQYNNCFAFIQNISSIVMSNPENQLQIWSLDTNTIVKSIQMSKQVTSICVSNDEKLIGISVPGQIQIWDFNKDSIILIEDKSLQHVIKLQFSKNNKIIICKDISFVKIWDISSKKLLKNTFFKDYLVINHEIQHPDSLSTLKQFQSFTVSACGKKLLIFKDVRYYEIWDLKAIKLICKRLNQGQNIIKQQDSSKVFLTGGQENNILKIWKQQSPTPVKEIQIEDLYGITGICTSNNTYVISNTQQIAIYDLKSEKERDEQMKQQMI